MTGWGVTSLVQIISTTQSPGLELRSPWLDRSRRDKRAIYRRGRTSGTIANELASQIKSSVFAFPQIVNDILTLNGDGTFGEYTAS
jgi:hypothetical protein